MCGFALALRGAVDIVGCHTQPASPLQVFSVTWARHTGLSEPGQVPSRERDSTQS